MHPVRFKQRSLLWTLLVLQVIAVTFCLFLAAFRTHKPQQQVSTEYQLQEISDKELFNTSECISLRVPGRASNNRDGFFSFITNYYFDRQSKNLFVVALEKEYFKYTPATRNYAINVSFPYENLVHPVRLTPFAWIIGLKVSVLCVEVNTGYKDVSIHDKIVLMKCSFGDTLLNTREIDVRSITEIFLVDVAIQAHTANKPSLCFRLDAKRPHGRLAEFNNRREVEIGDLKPNKPPTIVLCIGGINEFSRIIVRAIELQVRGFGIEHVYLGLNSDDSKLRQTYLESFAKEIRDRLSISLAPASSLDVEFSQGKVPFSNECLFWAKHYQDDLLAAWDGDEMLLTPQPIRQQMNLAQKLIEEIPDLLETGCYIDLAAQTFLRTTTKPHDENGLVLDLITNNTSNSVVVPGEETKTGDRLEYDHPVNLHQAFPYRAIYSCANYSKSISVVRKVEFISMHLPEACELYPTKGRRFSSKASSFVKRTSQVFLAHFVQAWIPDRHASRCPARRDVKDLRAFESTFSFKSR